MRIMNLLALASESASSALFRLFFLAGAGYLVVVLFFRRLTGGVLPAVRGATALAVAAAIYCGGLQFVGPCVPVLDSFDRPESVKDVTDPEKLVRLLQEHHVALVRTIEIQQETARNFHFISMLVGISGLSFLWRMRTAQREVEYFKRMGHRTPENQVETGS